MDTRLLCPWEFLGRSTRVGCHFLLQGIFLTQGSNPGLPNYRQTLYCLSHQGSPQSCLTLWDPLDYLVRGILQARILEWVAFPFSRGSSQPRDRTQVFCIAGGFFNSWATREAWTSIHTFSKLIFVDLKPVSFKLSFLAFLPYCLIYLLVFLFPLFSFWYLLLCTLLPNPSVLTTFLT